MSDRSKLGDLIVEHGPYAQDFLVGAGLSSDLRWVRAVELNSLRDELIRLRQAAEPVELAMRRLAKRRGGR